MKRQAPDSGCGCVVEVHSFSREELRLTLPRLHKVLVASGCWTFRCKQCGQQTVVYSFEVELGAVLDLYCGLVRSGLELTDLSHHALTELCTLWTHQAALREGIGPVSVQLSMSFVDADEEMAVAPLITASA